MFSYTWYCHIFHTHCALIAHNDHLISIHEALSQQILPKSLCHWVHKSGLPKNKIINGKKEA